MQSNNAMANDLIVDFPEHPHRHYNMMCQDLDCEGKNHPAGRGNSPHQASSRGQSHGRCHHHHHHQQQQPELSNHRSRGWNNDADSSDSRGRTDSDHPRSSGPTQAPTVRSVRFAKKSMLKLVTKHEDREDVDRQDLWYSEADLELMKLAAVKDVLKVRDQLASGVSIDYFLGNNDDSIVCLMGIEDSYSKAHAIEVKKLKKRCVHAVLQAQKMQQMMGVSSSLLFTDGHRQDLIALASFSQTRSAATRAYQLGLLHQRQV